MPQGQGNVAPSPLVSLFPIFVIFFIFYFLLIRPQKKSQQEHKKMLDGIKKNDEVVTTSGIYGTVIHLKDKTVVLRVDDNTKIEFDKSAITTVIKQKPG